MSPPEFYDANSSNEIAPPLPCAPLVILSENVVMQPPLTRRGTGPGMVIFIPATSAYTGTTQTEKSLDPEPVQKWAEEGFAVVGITSGSGWSVKEGLARSVEALLTLKELDTRDKFAVTVCDPKLIEEVVAAISSDPRLACMVTFGTPEIFPSVPIFVHLHVGAAQPPVSPTIHVAKYTAKSPYFVLPQADEYDTGAASMAHGRALVFLRKILGGPIFDIEAIWEEHTYFEFEARSVAKTMATMVAEPYVNHVTTMTGGIGRESLTKFYRDHFIFANPRDTELQPVSRTIGSDRVVDEFVFKMTHDKVVDWLLPGVPPTGKYLEVPMIGVVNVRGDRLYHEHIWWDQATALTQAGLLPSHVPWPSGGVLRLPVAGVECARMLVDETDGTSNEMFGWGVKDA